MALIHAPQTIAYRERALPVYAILPDHGEAVSKLVLKYQIQEQVRELRMLPVDGYLHEDSYSLYCATIPAAHMTGKLLLYSFDLEGLRWGSYNVPLQDAPTDLPQELPEPPAILPLLFPDRFYLASGDLVLHTVLFGEVTQPPVLILFKGSERIELGAEYTDAGEHVFVLPAPLLARLGSKLRFWIRAQGTHCSIQLWSEKSPCSVRLVDNAGPVVTRVHPAQGVILTDTRRPLISADFFDASGISHRTSVFCLDGQNCTADALWEEERVSYTPKHSLKKGAHVLELTLRDKLGNRSYYRVSFFVGNEGESVDKLREQPKRKSLGTPRLAAKTLSALRGLFSGKEK